MTRATMRARAILTISAVIGLGAEASNASAQATIGGRWRQDVSTFAQKIVDAGLTPGMAVGVATGDWVTYARGFGTTDMDTGRPVDGDTPFYIASSTKAFTALAVVLAASRGEIDLDAPFTRYVPNAKYGTGVIPDSVTVRALLDMTSGISGNGPVTLVTAYTGQFDPKALPAMLALHPSNGHVGSFVYDNIGYNMLGMVMAARVGGTWKDAVEREVLTPIGMPHTSAYWSRLDRDRVAYAHATTPNGFARIPVSKRDENLHAAGGLFASARDLARFLAVEVSGGKLSGVRVLPEKPIEETHVMRVAQDRQFGPFHRYGWAYGWDLGTYEGDTIVHRFGGYGGYMSHVSFMPSHSIGVTVLVNNSGPAVGAADLMATYVYDRLLGKPDLEAHYARRLDSLVAQAATYRKRLADALAARRARAAPLSHALADYAGVYENPELGRAEWREVAHGLELRLGVIESRAGVYDAAKNQLRVEVAGSGMVATFEFPPSGGAASGFELFGMPFRRVR
ncbi:MAG TPA: serine hydrolase domain-containing protein [Gemmatimonadales bacterium]|nr:serine hydrolase domain-containing protein [Gemmatimonadales bacterium]